MIDNWDDEPAFYVSELSANTIKLTGQINGKMQFSKQPTAECAVPVYWDKITMQRPAATSDRPAGWMIPRIVTFKDCEWTSAPKAAQDVLEGTVQWTLSPFGDTPPVTDKHGVTHYPRPLKFADE